MPSIFTSHHYLVYYIVLTTILILLTYWISRRVYLRKMKRAVMKAEHNYQQQVAALQMQLSGKVNMLEGMVEKLKLSNQELNRLSEIRSKFMSIVAHDLRQPLTSIQGFTSVLMMDSPQGEGNSEQIALNNILKATDNMNQLMADLMDISMIESGKFNMDFKEFNFNQLLDDVHALQQVNAQKKGIFLVKYAYPTDVLVYADRFRISQVLNNLLGNAIKFSPQGGRIAVEYVIENGWLLCAVQDEGPGIAPDEQVKIFQKFHQSEHDHTARKQGWGLGLSIAQEIVNAHQGEIGVSSAGLGQGATFWFRIPITSNTQPLEGVSDL
ncbi:MAG: HAMP domain-containing histidine kinase [Elusimicrobiaceae bacterium]|nr:HAMP domain-containing histidine kinase [Elusimicrobiaceae bacterium]